MLNVEILDKDNALQVIDEIVDILREKRIDEDKIEELKAVGDWINNQNK